jgi:hypothetical protein
MSTAELLERISSLPPDKQAAVEAYVADLVRAPVPSVEAFPRETFDRVNARREQIRADRGVLPDSAAYLRRMRDGDEY